MKIPFWKMNGAGNDFVLIDDRALRCSVAPDSMLKIAAQVPCEGILLLQPSGCADLKMRFFNPDGNEAEMCGNGARCFARLAYDLKAAPQTMQLETVAGIVAAEVSGGQVQLTMTAPQDLRLHLQLGDLPELHFLNTGVPHVVIRVEDAEETNVAQLGCIVREHPEFAPAGTNVNFVEVLDRQHVRLRTYERGVEAETGACGTGSVATALIAAQLGWVDLPVTLQCNGGELIVNYDGQSGTFGNVTLTGPAEYEFEGELDMNKEARNDSAE
jgi:diaminopimelate epimerase